MSRAFDLADEAAYRGWRERKLAQFPKLLSDLVVELRDPRALSPAEKQAILYACARADMAIYASRAGSDPDKDIPRRLGAQLGLRTLDPNGFLHMRYTARAVSIEWKSDAATKNALAALERILAEPSLYVFHGRLEPGMGLVCNNVLHTRTPFADSPRHKRLIYRARYYERVSAG